MSCFLDMLLHQQSAYFGLCYSVENLHIFKFSSKLKILIKFRRIKYAIKDVVDRPPNFCILVLILSAKTQLVCIAQHSYYIGNIWI